MQINRRDFLRAAPALTGGALAASCRTESQVNAARANSAGEDGGAGGWEAVRAQFNVSPEVIDMSALLISAHPRMVREAIERHRRGLDENPTLYLEDEIGRRRQQTLQAAANYTGGRPDEIALTDSTTMGLGLVYNGFQLQPAQEFLVDEHNYYSTREAIRTASLRTGAQARNFELYSDIQNVTIDEILENLVSAVRPETRVVAVTWVHSSTGLKLPVRRMAEALAGINAGRDAEDRVLLCVDGVHGFGIEDVEVAQLGCDFFMAGCHKWLFGPRGTGIVWGNMNAWNSLLPTIPTFRELEVRRAWMGGQEPSRPVTGATMTPGGFKAFEHLWAMADAFEFHENIGRARIAERTHHLARLLKEGLAEMPHVTLYTPLSEELSSGIVCFDVNGMAPQAVVDRLRQDGIVATTTPYAPSYPRLTPSIRNSETEIEAAVRAIADLG